MFFIVKMKDNWSLKGKADYAGHFERMEIVFHYKDIEVLRQKLIEDFKKIEKDWEEAEGVNPNILFEKIINKRFGVEKKMKDEKQQEEPAFSELIGFSRTYELQTPCNTLRITIVWNKETKKLDRTFIEKMHGASSCQYCLLQTISRLISLCLQHKIPKSRIIDEMLYQRCNIAQSILPRGTYMSCPHAFGMLLKKVPWELKGEE